jgi:hypothetical protein
VLCSAWALAEQPPVIAVAASGACPTDVLVRDRINAQWAPGEKPKAILGSRGDVLLAILETPPESDTVRIELRTRTGRVLMTRDLVVRSSSCAARARSIAVIVHRFLEKLPRADIAPRPQMRTVVTAPPRQPQPFERLEPRAGFSLDAGLGQDRVVGLTLGLAARPYRHLAAHLYGRVHWPRRDPAGEGEVTLSRHSLNLMLAAYAQAGAARLEAGAGGRLDWVGVETEGLPFTHRTNRYNPGATVFLGASMPVHGPLQAFTTVDFYALGREQSFVVEGVGEVARTSRYGLALTLGLGYGVLSR